MCSPNNIPPRPLNFNWDTSISSFDDDPKPRDPIPIIPPTPAPIHPGGHHCGRPIPPPAPVPVPPPAPCACKKNKRRKPPRPRSPSPEPEPEPYIPPEIPRSPPPEPVPPPEEPLPEPDIPEPEIEPEVTPLWKCHSLPSRNFSGEGVLKVGYGNPEEEEIIPDDDFYPKPKHRKHYLMINQEDIEYRPAALTQFPLIIRQISGTAHAEILKHGCQRLLPEKVVKERSTLFSPSQYHRAHILKRESGLKVVHESMERKLKRLRIYRRAFSSLVIYFRAYSPLLFHIKKAYEDVLRFRLRQFSEAQHERVRIYHDKIAVENKMAGYIFPDAGRLRKAEQYLNLLFVRIRKQDEAIQYITEILTKMERSLSDHFERYRDQEDQIKLLDSDLTDLEARSLAANRKFEKAAEAEAEAEMAVVSPGGGGEDEEEDEDEEEGEGGGGSRGGVSSFVKSLEEEAAGEPYDESEEFDEDKRVVLIMAYAVCIQELEDAQKKLRLYEMKFRIQRQKRRLRMGLLLDEEDGDWEEGEGGDEGGWFEAIINGTDKGGKGGGGKGDYDEGDEAEEEEEEEEGDDDYLLWGEGDEEEEEETEVKGQEEEEEEGEETEKEQKKDSLLSDNDNVTADIYDIRNSSEAAGVEKRKSSSEGGGKRKSSGGGEGDKKKKSSSGGAAGEESAKMTKELLAKGGDNKMGSLMEGL